MKCPYCFNDNTRVLDSRPTLDGSDVRRRRECNFCKKRFTTEERIIRIPIYVTKANGKIEEFDREKIYRGLKMSLVKRDYDINKLERLIDEVEREVLVNYGGKIRTSELGNIIMGYLLSFDEVAYIRFASVYNKFESLDSFIYKIKEIKAKKQKERRRK